MTLGFVPIVCLCSGCPEHLWLLLSHHLFYNDVRLEFIVRYQVGKLSSQGVGWESESNLSMKVHLLKGVVLHFGYADLLLAEH